MEILHCCWTQPEIYYCEFHTSGKRVNRVLVHLQWIVKLVHLRSVEMFQIPISRSGIFSAPPRQISCKDILKQREFMNG